jgi:hypothetical protein
MVVVDNLENKKLIQTGYPDMYVLIVGQLREIPIAHVQLRKEQLYRRPHMELVRKCAKKKNHAVIKLVIDRTFGSAELFGRTSTVRFGPNDRTFFCRTQNFFCFKFNVNDILSYF